MHLLFLVLMNIYSNLCIVWIIIVQLKIGAKKQYSAAKRYNFLIWIDSFHIL